MRIRDLVVLVIPVHEILQNSATFPDFQVVATLVRVDDGRNAAVRVDVEVPLLFLLVFKELNCAYLHPDCVRVFKISICPFLGIWSDDAWEPYVVLQAQFLQRDGNLEWVGSALTVEGNHLLCAHDGRG